MRSAVVRVGNSQAFRAPKAQRALDNTVPWFTGSEVRSLPSVEVNHLLIDNLISVAKRLGTDCNRWRRVITYEEARV